MHECDLDTDEAWLALVWPMYLGGCLRDAGALCRAWELGNEATPQAYEDYEEWQHASETHLARVGSWFPGCGREAVR